MEAHIKTSLSGGPDGDAAGRALERMCWSSTTQANRCAEAFARVGEAPATASALCAAAVACVARGCAAQLDTLTVRTVEACARVFDPRRAWKARREVDASALLAAALRSWSLIAAVLGVPGASTFTRRLPALVAHIDHVDASVRAAALAGIGVLFAARFEYAAKSAPHSTNLAGCPPASNLGVVLAALACGTQCFTPEVRARRRARDAHTALCAAVWATATSGADAPCAELLYAAASTDGPPGRYALSGSPFAGAHVPWGAVVLFAVQMRSIGDGERVDIDGHPVAMRVATVVAMARGGETDGESDDGCSGGGSARTRAPSFSEGALESTPNGARAAARRLKSERKQSMRMERGALEVEEASQLEASLQRARGKRGAHATHRRPSLGSSPKARRRARSIDSFAANAFDDDATAYSGNGACEGGDVHTASGLDGALAATSAVLGVEFVGRGRSAKAVSAKFAEQQIARIRAERPELQLSQVHVLVEKEWRRTTRS